MMKVTLNNNNNKTRAKHGARQEHVLGRAHQVLLPPAINRARLEATLECNNNNNIGGLYNNFKIII